MSIILGVDTSTEACSVALLCEGEVLEDYRVLPREHTLHLLPMIDGLLQQGAIQLADLDAIAFTAGPGSFTGLRVCTGVVQGLALGAELPVIPVSTLKVLAQTALALGQAEADQAILASLDARMDEVYWAIYQSDPRGGLSTVVPDRLTAPEQLDWDADLQATLVAVGSGLVYQNRIPRFAQFERCEPGVLPRASALVTLAERELRAGKAMAADAALPVYLRDEVAWKS